MNRVPSSRRPAGFTLIEALIALALLGIGLGILTASVAGGLSVTRRARDYENARHMLDLVPVVAPLPDDPEEWPPPDDEGTFEPPHEQYRWTRTFLPVREEFETEPLYQINTRVYWSDRGAESFEEIVTYRLAVHNITMRAPSRSSRGRGSRGGTADAGGRDGGGAAVAGRGDRGTGGPPTPPTPGGRDGGSDRRSSGRDSARDSGRDSGRDTGRDSGRRSSFDRGDSSRRSSSDRSAPPAPPSAPGGNRNSSGGRRVPMPPSPPR